MDLAVTTSGTDWIAISTISRSSWSKSRRTRERQKPMGYAVYGLRGCRLYLSLTMLPSWQFMLHELCETSVNLALLSLISEMVPQSYPQLSDQTAETAPITSAARGFPPTSYDTYCESTPEDNTLIEQVRRHPCRLGAERHVVSSSLRSLEPLNTPPRLEARRRADRLSTGPASSFADVQIPP